jgi:uncharacterized membrane protein
MPWINQKNPQMVERAVAGLCYLSGGLIGLLYIVISRSKSQSMFFRFHFLQSMILVALGFLLSLTLSITNNILGGMASLMQIGEQANTILNIVGIGVEWIMRGGILLVLYGMVMAFLGKYAEIPVVSPLVRQNMR